MTRDAINAELVKLHDAVERSGREDAYVEVTHDGEARRISLKVFGVDLENGWLDGKEYSGMELDVKVSEITFISLG
jgi:hypothetical protein